jgi:PKD repeat protein
MAGLTNGTSSFVYNSASNVKTILATWTFDTLSLADTGVTNVPLDITIEVTATDWSIDILGDTADSGFPISFSGTHAGSGITNSVDTGHAFAFNQSESPNLAMSIGYVEIATLASVGAVIDPSVTAGYNPLEVEFDGSSSVGIGTITSYDWAFGDGSIDSGAMVTHTYLQPGAYTNWLTIMSDGGTVASNSVAITVNPALQANITTSQNSFYPPAKVIFDGSSSTSVYGNVTSYSWVLGDGKTSSEAVVTNTFTLVGAYTNWLTVTDDQGNITSNSAVITVSDVDYGIAIDDEFDNDDITTNPYGIGTGFLSGVQTTGFVVETNSAVTLGSPNHGGARSRISSKETADTTIADGASYLFEGVNFDLLLAGGGTTHRTYLGIRDNAGVGDEGINPEEGFFVEFGFGEMSGNAAGTSSFVYNNAANVKTVLASWTFDNLLLTDAAVSSNVVLDIEIIVDPIGWYIDIDGDTAGGSPISFSGTHAASGITNTVDTGHVFAHNQCESPNLAMTIGHVVVNQIQGSPLVEPNITAYSTDGTTVSLSWDSEAGFHYNVLSKDDLVYGVWSTNVAAVPSVAATTSTNLTTSGGSVEFFKIEGY